MSEDDTQKMPVALAWHAEVWRHFGQALCQGRVAHGLLFHGPRGVGKRALAERLMAALLCRDRKPNQDACGVCAGCRQRLAQTHPDVSRLVPEEPGKRIKVEQVRRFAHALHLTPQYDSGRIGWIDPADALSTSAANSLLKTLEEPPAGCHIILVSDQLSALLPTIRSRCQLWRVPGARPDDARAFLESQGIASHDIPDDRLRAPLAVVDATARDLDSQIAQWDQDFAKLVARRANPVSVAERAAAADRRLWADWIYRRCSDALAVCVGAPPATPMPDGTVAALQALGASQVQAWSREVAASVRRIDSNADWRLVLEALFIDLSQRVARINR